MPEAAQARSEDERVPQLTPGWEDKAAALSPEEGFLLSRIDGRTSWGVLRSISGLPADTVDTCLERCLRDGLIQLARPKPPQRATPAGAARVDANLDISVGLQQRILDFAQQLERPYHQILGVAPDADARTIKRAYFKLSKDFHPDRYFRKEIGAFAEMLDRVFKKIALGYELLMDPTTRAELERSLGAGPGPEPQAAVEPASGDGAAPQAFSKREWLARMRKSFKLPEEVLVERRFRAKQLAESAHVARHQRNWKDAASYIRLAIAFDPWNEAHKEAFAEIQVEVNRVRADQLLKEASGAWDSSSCSEALRLYEEVLHYRPSDASAHDKAAQVCFELDKFERAQEYADRACELEPEVAGYRLTRGRVLRRRGRREQAERDFELAQQLDPQDTRAGDELRKLRQRPDRAYGGKR